MINPAKQVPFGLSMLLLVAVGVVLADYDSNKKAFNDKKVNMPK
jgi:hypothetical protein